jgi:hypothetical protein
MTTVEPANGFVGAVFHYPRSEVCANRRTGPGPQRPNPGQDHDTRASPQPRLGGRPPGRAHLLRRLLLRAVRARGRRVADGWEKTITGLFGGPSRPASIQTTSARKLSASLRGVYTPETTNTDDGVGISDKLSRLMEKEQTKRMVTLLV